MKKKVFNGIDFSMSKTAIKNALTEEGAALKDALLSLVSELENSEIEYDEKEFADKLKETLAQTVGEKVAEEVANQMAKKMQAIQNAMNAGKTELPMKVKNEIAGAILHARNRDDVEKVVNEVLVKNDISGLTFGDVIDYAIVDNWGDMNPLFAKLKKSFFNKFFYNEDDLQTAGILAKQWDSANAENIEKTIQSLTLEGKTINTDFVYKRQRASLKDLSKIEKEGQTSNFLRWINEELDRQIVNTIVMAILIGDDVNPLGSRVTTFETIGTKTASDFFTTIVNPEDGSDITLADVRNMCNKVKNPFGKEKWLVIGNDTLSSIASFIYAAGGTTDFRSLDELKVKLGVDAIFVADVLDAKADIHAICMIPDGYWYVEDAYLAVSYPTYEKNAMNYQKERNIGGGIHDALSTAVLKNV